MQEERNAQQLCQAGKAAFFHKNADGVTREQGLKMLLEAQRLGEPEASYLVALLILEGGLTVRGQDPEDHAMTLMAYAAEEGYVPAKARLDAMCELRYRYARPVCAPKEGPLTDFAGEPIAIRRTGFFTPVDAVLSYENGENVLTLSTNVRFVYTDDLPHAEQFEQAVLAGFQDWAGTYRVFGDQKLRVQVELSREDQFFDVLQVIPIGDVLNQSLQKTVGMLHNPRAESILQDKRSFASMGLRWSATSRKSIWLQGDLTDLAGIRQTARHEFGHVLGLGDLYESAVDSLAGVREGTYPELDCYAITDKLYHLVMCTGAGPVSNNDVEMVVLAFRENRLQVYQKDKKNPNPSAALGKGN